jgi:2'-5' RNA ligase
MAGMRLFIAVEIDEAVRAAASRAAEDVHARLSKLGPVAVGWVRPESMHLTVRFIGEVGEDTCLELRSRLSTPLRTPAFDLAVSGVGVFPPRGPIRVIWLGLPQGAEELVALHQEIEGRISGLGFAPEDRPFRPHLTLGRVKAPLPRGARDIIDRLPAAPIGRSSVGQVTLFQSRLSPHGAKYVALARAGLRRPEDER